MAIQVIVAYCMELALAVFLLVPLCFWAPTEERAKRFRRALRKAYRVFADAAVVYTFSIQLACIIILSRKDFGISANGAGDLTVEVTWSVALLTTIPLVLVCFLPEDLERKELRFGIVCLSLVFFMYTFLSRMIADFGPSQISTSPAAVISPGNWTVIEDLCSVDPLGLSSSKTVVYDVFAIAGSLFVAISVWVLFFGRYWTGAHPSAEDLELKAD